MIKKFILIISILFINLFVNTNVYADSIPVENVFSDIASDYKYIKQLQEFYDKGMISPDSEGKFNPYSLLNRDDFVGIASEVSCKKCIKPNVESFFITTYNDNPFFDVDKFNKNFYCIADAKANNFVKGYNVDHTCDDNTFSLGEIPFCANNNIILEEALAVLLRMSGILTNQEAEKVRQDILKGTVTESLSDDVSPKNLDGSLYSFYPDFQKALEYEVVEYDTEGNKQTYHLIELVDNKLRPKKNITKEEFLRIAFVALKANSCQEEDSSLALKMKIFDKLCTENQTNCNFSDLEDPEDIYDFTLEIGGICEKGIEDPEGYIWRFYNNDSGEEIKKYGKYIDNYKFLSDGNWRVFLRVIDNCGNTSEVYDDILIGNIGEIDDILRVGIDANPIIGEGPLKVDFEGIANGGSGKYTYEWDFGDGNTGFGKNIDHIFQEEGTYVVKLKITDENGNIGEADVIIKVLTKEEKLVDNDDDGIYDFEDDCPLINGVEENNGCPIFDEKCDNDDDCNAGYECLENSFGNKLCLPQIIDESCNYTGGDLIYGNAICNTCPCNNSLEFISSIRKCDKIFPAITSPDSKSIYSQGKVFEIE